MAKKKEKKVKKMKRWIIWMIVLIIVAVVLFVLIYFVLPFATIKYFGISKPVVYIPDTCILSPPFGCNNDKTIANGATNKISLAMINNGSASYIISQIRVEGCNNKFVPSVGAIKPGVEQNYAILCSETSISSGSSLTSSIQIFYVDEKANNQIAYGSLVKGVK